MYTIVWPPMSANCFYHSFLMRIEDNIFAKSMAMYHEPEAILTILMCSSNDASLTAAIRASA